MAFNLHLVPPRAAIIGSVMLPLRTLAVWLRGSLFAAVVMLIGNARAADATASTVPADPVASLVAQLDLEKYKATIKALTRFGDRRQGTDRNRAAVDWMLG